MLNYYIYMLILFGMIIFSLRKQNDREHLYTYNLELPIRGILVLLVIFNHAFKNAYLLGNIAVSLFFSFSGYGLMKGYLKEGEKYFKRGYWSKKFINIIIPYFLINILYILWDICISGNKYDVKIILSSFFTAKIMTVGWYVIVILLLYFIFYFVYYILKIDEDKKIYVLFGIEVGLIVFLWSLGCGSWWYCSIFSFVIGIAKSKKIFWVERLTQKGPVIMITTLFILTYGITSWLGIFEGVIFLLIKVFMSISICIIYYGLFKRIEIRNNILKLIGKNSFLIYLIHPIFAKIWQMGRLDNNFEILFVISQIICSLLFSISYKKIVLNIKEK